MQPTCSPRAAHVQPMSQHWYLSSRMPRERSCMNLKEVSSGSFVFHCVVSTATVPHCTTATVKPSTVDLPGTESDKGKSKLTLCCCVTLWYPRWVYTFQEAWCSGRCATWSNHHSHGACCWQELAHGAALGENLSQPDQARKYSS